MVGALVLFTLLGQQPIEGSYVGSLAVAGSTLRLGLEIKASGGELSCELTSIDQGYKKLPAAVAERNGSTLKFAVPALGISFEGQQSEDGLQVSGKFTQGLTYDLTFQRVAAIPRPVRPQEPKAPFPYRSIEVRFPGGDAGVVLAATLTIPVSVPRGVIVLLAASGPYNRDQEMLAHRPFLVLADVLARFGFAVLRYDKRGVGGSTGDFKVADIPAFARDAASAVAFLRKRDDVGNRIALLGHSEGGLIAPIVAAEDSRLVGVALLAAPAVTGEQILRRQIPALGFPEAMLKSIEASLPNDAALRYFWSYDPLPTLSKVQCPVLLIGGELDLQVAADQNMPLLEETLRKAGNKAITSRRLPRLNHLLQTAQTGKQQEYGQIEETIAPVVLEEVKAWLEKLFPTRAKQ